MCAGARLEMCGTRLEISSMNRQRFNQGAGENDLLAITRVSRGSYHMQTILTAVNSQWKYMLFSAQKSEIYIFFNILFHNFIVYNILQYFIHYIIY